MYQPIPYWVKRAVRVEKELVKIITPITIRNRPLTRETERM
jgi:hypothetical protein